MCETFILVSLADCCGKDLKLKFQTPLKNMEWNYLNVEERVTMEKCYAG